MNRGEPAVRPSDHGRTALQPKPQVPSIVRMATAENADEQGLRLTVRGLTCRDAALIAEWRYAGPWSIYSSKPGSALLRAEDGYFAVDDADSGALIGFGCVGDEARVPGSGDEEGTVDVGVGMAPAMVGRGFGRSFAETVLRHVLTTGNAQRLRAVVRSWNERSLRLSRGSGFAEAGRHVCVQNGEPVTYVVLVRELAAR